VLPSTRVRICGVEKGGGVEAAATNGGLPGIPRAATQRPGLAEIRRSPLVAAKTQGFRGFSPRDRPATIQSWRQSHLQCRA
jgi:hypothetical protein